MPDNIDSLQIEISANAQKADRALENLTKTLSKFSSSLSGLQTSKFYQLADGMGKFASAMTGLNGSVKAQDFTRIASGLNKIASINSSGLRSAAVAMQGLSKSLNNISFISFDSQGIANMANAISLLGRKTITQAAANIPQLTTSLKGLVNGMNSIGAIKFDVSGLAQLTSSISKLGGKTATNAVPNIQNLAVALKNMMQILSTAPRVSQNLIQMTQALAQLAANGTRAGTATRSLASSFNIFSSSAKNARKHTFSLAAAFGKFYATYWLIIRGLSVFKDAIDISSSLTEVQNVVDVTFGNMADKVDELASHSIQDFGMSELTTKTIASRFQAMGTAMGFAQDRMSDMSIELTKLAADMASFYNVDQEEVARSLQSIFTGETEPMRRYGVDLTNATVQQWALNNGIKANMATMTNAEKTLLRYQYTMEATAAAQGDFARTSGSWANQLRILTQSFQALGAIVGEVLINAFKPFISMLNSVMQSVINFARTIANALGNIFGWTYEVSGGGLTDDFEGAASGAGDLDDNLGGAADKAKKLKDYMLGIDELNVISPEEPDSGSGGGAGGAGGGGAGDAGKGEWIKGEGLLEKYKSEIDSLYELGKYIGQALIDAMNSIDWESVYESARDFGHGLAMFLNGLITPELFGTIGETVAKALNAALWVLNEVGKTFDWNNFGRSIAEGINRFFQNFDFGLLADTINVWAHGLLDTMITAIDRIDWRMIGTKIGEFLADIDFTGIGKKIGQLIWKAINAGLDLWNGMFDAAPIETTIITALGAIKLSKVASPLIKQLGKLTDAFKLSSKAIKGNGNAAVVLAATYPSLAKTLSNAVGIFNTFQNTLAVTNDVSASLSASMAQFRGSLSGLAKGVVSVAAAFVEFNFVKDNIEQLTLGTGNLGESIVQMGTAIAGAGAAFSLVLGFPAGLIATGVVGLIAAIAGVKSAMDEISEGIQLSAIADALQNPGGVPLSSIGDSYVQMATTISSQFDAINLKSQELQTTRTNIEQTTASLDPYVLAIQNGAAVTDESVTAMTNDFQRLLNESSTLLEQQSLIIYSALAGSLGEAVESAGGSIDEYILITDQLKTESQKSLDEISESLSKLQEDYQNNIITQEQYAESLMDLIGKYNDLTGSGSEVKTAISGIRDVVSAGIDWTAVTYEDGSLNTSALTAEIERVGTSFSEAKETVSSSGEEIMNTINSLIEQAQATGDTEAETALTQLLKYQEEELERQTGEIERLAGEYTLTLQNELINKIPEIFANAETEWEGLSGWEKLWIPKEDAVSESISQFNTDYITPLETELENTFGQFGEACKPFMSSAMDTIMEGVIESDSVSGNPYWTTHLTTNIQGLVEGAISEASSGVLENAKPLGEDINKGLEAGVNENIGIAKDAGTTVGESAIDAARTALDSHSPSRVFADIGRDVVSGFNQGILEGDTSSSISTWMENIKSQFSAEQWTAIFANILPAFQTAWATVMEWWNGVAMVEFWTTLSEGTFSVENWMLLFQNILLAFQTSWAELSAWWIETLAAWWETGVIPYFGVEKWMELWEGIRKVFTSEWTLIDKDITKKFQQFFKSFDEKSEEMKIGWEERLTFMKEFSHNTFQGIKTDAVSALEEIMRKIQEVSNALSNLANQISSVSSMSVNVSVSGGVRGFATGGFPEMGELFVARESGPEFVGSVGSRTAVANNDQIVSGIAAGVRDAIVEVLTPYLDELTATNREIADKDTSIQLDGRELVAGIDQRRARNGYNFT